MVTQLSGKFGVLKRCSQEDLKSLKTEIKPIMKGGTIEELSELSKQVAQTRDEFRNQANKGMLTQEYQEATEVMKICAGCGGLIHGKE